MKYLTGNTGRVFLVKLDDDDDVLKTIEGLAAKENIHSGLIFIIGNLKKGSLVSGAEKESLPVIPLWNHFEKNHEMLGIGTIFLTEGRPGIHLHAAFGRGKESLTGCLREKSGVFLVSEIIVLELTGMEAVRDQDEKTGLTMLRIP